MIMRQMNRPALTQLLKTPPLILPARHQRRTLAASQVNDDGTINHCKSSIITICGFVRSVGQGDAALQKVLHEKNLI